MRRIWLIFLFALPGALTAQPVCDAWIKTREMASAGPALGRVLPEVHGV